VGAAAPRRKRARGGAPGLGSARRAGRAPPFGPPRRPPSPDILRVSPLPFPQTPKPPAGSSFDFLALNLLGWVAYATFNLSIYFVFECHQDASPAAAPAAALSPAAGAAAALGGGGGLLGGSFLGAAPRVAELAALGKTDFCQVGARPGLVVFVCLNLFAKACAAVGNAWQCVACGRASSLRALVLQGAHTHATRKTSRNKHARARARTHTHTHTHRHTHTHTRTHTHAHTSKQTTNQRPTSPPNPQYAVEANDVMFALHALLLTLVTAAQCFMYPRGKQRVHGAVLAAAAAAAAGAAAYAAAVKWRWAWLPAAAGPYLEWLDWLYFLAYIKLAVTLTKYLPQARVARAARGGARAAMRAARGRARACVARAAAAQTARPAPVSSSAPARPSPRPAPNPSPPPMPPRPS
jgi:hypothetical protein